MKVIWVLIFGVLAMSCVANDGRNLQLAWEWPSGRPASSTLLISVTDIKKQKKGWFGLWRSPSIANNLPDATEIRGKPVSETTFSEVVVVVPGPELPAGLRIGDQVELSLLEGNKCIAITLRK
jgi:hypothetical protein